MQSRASAILRMLHICFYKNKFKTVTLFFHTKVFLVFCNKSVSYKTESVYKTLSTLQINNTEGLSQGIYCKGFWLVQNGTKIIMCSWKDNFHVVHGQWRLPAGGVLHPRLPGPLVFSDASPALQSTPCSAQGCQTELESASSSDSAVWSPFPSWSSDFWGCCRWFETGNAARSSSMPAPCRAGRCCHPGLSLSPPAKSVHRTEISLLFCRQDKYIWFRKCSGVPQRSGLLQHLRRFLEILELRLHPQLK